MPFLNVKDKQIEVDEKGFLVNQDDWNGDVAKALLKHHNGPEPDPETLEILRFIHNYYKKFSAFPIMKEVCKRVDQPKQCVQEHFLDPALAWKAAGLPKPDTMYTESHDDAHKIYKIITAQ